MPSRVPHEAVIAIRGDAKRSVVVSAAIHALEPPPGRFADDDDATTSKVRLSPTAAEPLRGLPALAAVATMGVARLRELAGQEVNYVWSDIAVSGTIILLASGPSEGKTTLLFQLLVARANRGIAVWLLERRVEPAPPGKFIVIIEGEHAESSAARKLLASCALLYVDEKALDRIVLIARKAVRIGSPEWSDIVRMVAAGLVSDIAIDTVARVAPSDANDEREQVAVFDMVAQAIEAAPSPADRPTVWAAAHTRKNGRTGDLTDVSGSAQRTGQADSVLMLDGRKEGGRTVSTTVTFAKLREEPNEYPSPVTFAIVTNDAGKKVLRTGSSVAEDDSDEPLETRITNRLKAGPLTKNKLRNDLGRSAADMEVAISNLFASRQISTTNINVRGRSFTAFTLRSVAKSTPDFSPDSASPDSHRTSTGRNS